MNSFLKRDCRVSRQTVNGASRPFLILSLLLVLFFVIRQRFCRSLVAYYSLCLW